MNKNVLTIAMVGTLSLAGCADREMAAESEPSAPFDAEVTLMIDEYESTAQALSAQLGAAPREGRHDLQIERLLQLAAGITPAFTARRPECKAYLDAALRIQELWYTLSPEVIERDYHDDAALPSEGISPACYHMKDLIVHPATAAALLKGESPDYDQAKREIDEVLAHVGVVRGG